MVSRGMFFLAVEEKAHTGVNSPQTRSTSANNGIRLESCLVRLYFFQKGIGQRIPLGKPLGKPYTTN